ncbi:type II secretion system GspH family protein [Fluoribacter dumoffii]|uniref:Tfp pilus assembly protein PilV n=1 Tax=Fluoribacter dumoffii TaxID=463 RepID=A0A377GAE5_9GAMM|nr:type II secretion system protein [Fluoribacter dumoffii]KTC88715.1 hypothetical protein Ldum_2973 [Fluoribacter dumoffii NY 23]MCW8385992.1 type II secretion system GspH family protein [Fluoribacter dumoffii]MCW8419044.1 type II secretion system GspH family protein [Fluoribacter dumoffii]MCW8453112.1 type II secretion system GspH family protein [Fluoribacter dumoffii]MCW8459670.1 type II secretion system GspH family protein [Fluoribacter dumoffii]
MRWQKGFSLTEVLVSLLFVTTLFFSLFQQQYQSKHLLNQVILRMEASQFIDQIEEALLAQAPKLPSAPLPYHLEIQNKREQILIHLAWLEQPGSLTRNRRPIGYME